MSVKQALAPLFAPKTPVVARTFSPQALKETILYLKTEIAGIKEMIAKRKLLLKQQKAAGKSVAHLERANARAAKELATFEARLQDFEKRRAAAKDLAPNPARPPKTRTAVAPVPKTVPRPGRHAAQR